MLPPKPRVARLPMWTKLIVMVIGLALITTILATTDAAPSHDWTNEENAVDRPEHKALWKKFKRWIKKKFRRRKPKPNPAPAGLPDASFKLLFTITDVTYEKPRDQQRFLRNKGFGYIRRIPCTEHKKWKLCAYRDTRKRRLYFSFRGSKHFNNWIHDANKVFGGKAMNRVLGHFDAYVQRVIRQNRGYFPYAFCGHSAGGFFAVRVLKSRRIWRFTVNALKAQTGKYTINVRSRGDIVSKSPFSKKYRYITITRGGHKMKNFRDVLNKPWRKLSSVFRWLRVIRLPGQPR